MIKAKASHSKSSFAPSSPRLLFNPLADFAPSRPARVPPSVHGRPVGEGGEALGSARSESRNPRRCVVEGGPGFVSARWELLGSL